MASYKLSRAADHDLARIAEYTVERFGVAQAIAYRDGLIRAFEFLATYPQAARLRIELKPPLRAHRYQTHLVLYDILPEGSILVIRIRHGSEDWQAGGG